MELSIKQKLVVMKAARQIYVNRVNTSVSANTYGAVCGSIGRAAECLELWPRGWVSREVRAKFPELLEYKPKHAPVGDLWWPRDDTATRLRVFDELIKSYEDELESSTEA